MIPQYTDQEFIQAMQLLDLVILDIGSLSYKYSVLTASVIYHCQDEQAALTASGKYEKIELTHHIKIQKFRSSIFNFDNILTLFFQAIAGKILMPA